MNNALFIETESIPPAVTTFSSVCNLPVLYSRYCIASVSVVCGNGISGEYN
jgi:hypothetical protein